MVSLAVRATNHLAAWLCWHAAHVSLLDDLPEPAPPHAAGRVSHAA